MSFEIDHLGIAVKDLNESLKMYRDLLGASVSAEEAVPHEGVRVAVLPAGTKANIELLQATEPDSPIAKFVAKRGPGLHHVAIRVDDLTDSITKLRAAGHEVLNAPQIGAGGHRYVFLHPRSTGGVLLELVESVSS